jgi:hypothetical protein
MPTAAGTPSASSDEIFDLIRQHTSQAVVRDFLKIHKAAYSATSWDLLGVRVQSALTEELISKVDLYHLLCDVEEHGRQRVYVFQRNPAQAAKMFEPATLEAALKSAGLAALRNKPRVQADPPKQPTLVDVRVSDDGDSLVLKFIEGRKRYLLVEEGEEAARSERNKRQWVKRWDIKESRAVNVVKLRADGLCEIRIALGADDYEAAIGKLKADTAGMVPWDKFSEVSLSKVKQALWKQRDALETILSFSNSNLRDDKSGVTMTAATGRIEDDIRQSSGAERALQLFLDSGAHVEGSSIYFKPQGDPPTPARILHVVIQGNVNEFAIPVQCGIKDHEYVLEQLRRHNR